MCNRVQRKIEHYVTPPQLLPIKPFLLSQLFLQIRHRLLELWPSEEVLYCLPHLPCDIHQRPRGILGQQIEQQLNCVNGAECSTCKGGEELVADVVGGSKAAGGVVGTEEVGYDGRAFGDGSAFGGDEDGGFARGGDGLERGRGALGFGVAGVEDHIVFDLEFFEKPEHTLRLRVLGRLAIVLVWAE